ncbi:UNVERIFIED_CONTAM: hypothetical protein Cloal_0944 [Acetivibrio alkalicellulosi]
MTKYTEETGINIKDTLDYTKRLDTLAEKLEKTKESIEINRKYTEQYNLLEKALPKDKLDLIRQLDDTYMELLILHEEFFYKSGHMDRPEFNGLFNKIKNWLFGS